jgi:protein-tyrosine kinase
MSRIHDALRRAEKFPEQGDPPSASPEPHSLIVPEPGGAAVQTAPLELPLTQNHGLSRVEPKTPDIEWRTLLSRCRSVAFRPAPDTHLFDARRPQEAPSEEFRVLRTRLNHMQSSEDLRSIVVTSASPAEGKTFVALNLALAQSQLEAPILIIDLDLRRPTVHELLRIDRTPGFSDFLVGEKPLDECIRHIEGTNLYVLPAGTLARNPLELLNMRHVKILLDNLRKIFGWIIMDTPPLLFSADANLMATLTDGTVLVVRIGSTTYDTVVRAMQSLCENNVLGIVANGARAGELYSKYTYYYSRRDDADDAAGAAEEEADADE